MSIQYFHPLSTERGFTLSVDNVRINFEVDGHKKAELEQFFADFRNTHIKSYPEDTRDFRYKYLFSFAYTDDFQKTQETMTCGYMFNGADVRQDITKGFLDFNPNKVGDSPQFWKDFHFIRSCCDSWNVARCDVALDIPVKREYVILEKDNRVYECKAYSLQNMTECLGLRSQIGRVKVYNKTLESKLPYDLTRIEVTCEMSVESYLAHFPRVWDITQGGQLTMDILELNDTELGILRLCLENMRSHNDNGLMILNSMGRKIKQKLKKFLLPESCLVFSLRSEIRGLIDSAESLYK